MLQWMGGSRRKVTTSRKSTQKRQQQYFEQRKRQQQYRQQTSGFDTFDNERDLPEKHCKEHRSLDVSSLLNLSKIAQECRSSCPTGLKDLRDEASKMEFDNSNGLSTPSSDFQPDFAQFKESRIPSAFQMETASPKNSTDIQTSALNRVNSNTDQRETTAEKPLSVLDLLVDDNPDVNMEGNTPHEAHVAFSVEGLGKVGTKTSIHSPRNPSRTFSYGLSSPVRSSGQSNLSKNFNSLLDDLETEVDTRMQDDDFSLDNNHSNFSSDYMNLLSSPKQKSFTFRDAQQHDGHMTKKNCFSDRRNAEKCDVMSPLQYDSLFDERGSDISGKNRQSRMDDSPADNLTCRAYDPPEFSFEARHKPFRAAENIRDKFDILESRSPISKHVASEENCDFLVSDWTRHPITERKYDHVHRTNQTERFTTVPEDAKENSSLHSEESCSSTAVRHPGNDDSLSNATSRNCRRRPLAAKFLGSGNKFGMKGFSKKGKENGQLENISARSASHAKFLDPLAQQRPSSLFEEHLETSDNWLFEERHSEVDIDPQPSPFNRDSDTKKSRLNSDKWDRDLFSEFPAPKSQFDTNHQGDGGFHHDPLGDLLSGLKIPMRHSSPKLSKPEHTDFSFTAADISPQESLSKDIECNAKLRPSSYETFDLGEEFFVRNENLVSTDCLSSMTNDHEEQTLQFDNTANREEECVNTGNGDHRGAYKISRLYQSGKKENMEEFGPKEHTSYTQNSGYVDSPRQAMMLQSYVLQLFCVQKRLKY